MTPSWTDAPHDPTGTLWPATDPFIDDTFEGQPAADTRLCQRAPVGDHIRLVRILSARPNGVMCCETCVSPLDAPQQYTAVSYAWGSQLKHHPVILDGRQHLVTENLWRFLNHAVALDSNFSGSGWLWIDALSIDQRTPRERAYQVGIMSSIFWKAKRVVVWLGPAYNQSGEAMKALSAAVVRLQHVGALPLPWTTLAESAFVGLCERTYWRRTWVFQELRAARDVHLMCGSDIVPCGAVRSNLWRFFGDFVSDDTTGQRLPRCSSAAEAVRCSPAFNMIKHVFLVDVNRVQTSLWTLLISTRDLQCADARDRVYSLLSISTSGLQGIRADYEVSLTCLLNVVLRNWHAYLRPSSLQEVNRQCTLLADIFRVGREIIYTLSSPDMSETSYSPNHLQELEWKQEHYQSLSIWAEFYGHRQACRLLQATTETFGVARNQVRPGIPASNMPNATGPVRPRPNEPRPQAVAQKPGCGTLFQRGWFHSLWSVDS
jgi:hypothetical protein